MSKEELLQQITDFYLQSRDFNGLPVRLLESSEPELRELVEALVQEDLISINFGDIHPNPHILAFKAEDPNTQIRKMHALALEEACLYPSPKHLESIVDKSFYQDEPFRLKLALGEPQLSYYSFDLSILEMYRNDPRYHYHTNDVSGRIGTTSKASLEGQISTVDQVVLQTFGFSYDSAMNRAVAVYLCYLRCLTPEHQRIWQAKMLPGDYKLHPDYHRQTLGHWPEGVSIFTAFLEEQRHINRISELMGNPTLFRREYESRERPKEFGFLVRPTLAEFNAFVLVLDKLISENLNPAFFEGEVALEEEQTRGDGKVVVKQKGTLRLLDEWLCITFPDPGPKEKDGMIATFKRIRKLRQRPAHALHENEFDQKYFREQRKLAIEAYTGIRTLRLIFQNHPTAEAYNIPERLQKREIWTY